MIREMVDVPDVIRDKTINVTLQGGQSFMGLRLVARLPLVDLLEFMIPGGMTTYIRQNHISSIEVWDD